MFRFRMEVAGEVAMDRGIARFADGVADYRPIWPVIEDEFYGQMKAQFQTEGSEGGERWAPLSDAYAAAKEIEYPGMPILQRTGHLVNSLTTGTDPDSVKIEQRKTLTLGTRLPYALYHQQGTSKMPARPEVQLPEPFKRMVMHHIQTYLVQIASQSGFRTKGTIGPLGAAAKSASAARMTPAGSSRVGRRT